MTNELAALEIENSNYQSSRNVSSIEHSPKKLFHQHLVDSFEEEEEEEETRETVELKPPLPPNHTKVQHKNSNCSKPFEVDLYNWRIDLSKSEPFWNGWFQGLSQKFLSVPQPKVLLLANISGLDTTLTIGQMQGKDI